MVVSNYRVCEQRRRCQVTAPRDGASLLLETCIIVVISSPVDAKHTHPTRACLRCQTHIPASHLLSAHTIKRLLFALALVSAWRDTAIRLGFCFGSCLGGNLVGYGFCIPVLSVRSLHCFKLAGSKRAVRGCDLIRCREVFRCGLAQSRKALDFPTDFS